MADASFDVVVIGGGQQGLVIGNYLAKNGMTVGLFEQTPELGGPAHTASLPAAGFLGNDHAQFIAFWMCPAYYDFKLREKGLKIILPEVMLTKIFPDERCITAYTVLELDETTGAVLPRQDIIEKNLEELERISPRDAERMAKFFEKKAWNWMLSIGQFFFNPPPLPGEPDYMGELLNDPEGGFDARYPYMTTWEIACDLFDSAEIRSFFLEWNYMNVVAAGDVAPVHLAILPVISLTGFSLYGIAEGGAHNIAHALQRAFSELGGKFLVGADVDQVLVENGRARGIKLADGSEIEAKRLVIDTAEIKQGVSRHLRNVNIAPEIRRKVDNLLAERTYCWGHIAFHELPQYKAASWNPDCAEARLVLMGDGDTEYLCRHYAYEMRNLGPGRWPRKICMEETTSTLWDPSYAPQGKHVAAVGSGGWPTASSLSEKEWTQVKKEAIERYLRQWQKYAPNMTWDNVIATHFATPYDIAQRNSNWVDGCGFSLDPIASQWGSFRPIPELAQYQVPGVENLWLSSGSHHQGGVGTLASPAYCCYKRIAQKYNLWKPWEGRLY